MVNDTRIYLVAAADRNYLEKAIPYLGSIDANSNVSNIFFTVDFDISEELKKKFSSIDFRKIDSGTVKSPNINKCIQHGGFLGGLNDVADTSVIVFTDTDIKMQRRFSESDLQLLRNCKDGQVLVNHNTTSISKDRTSLLDDAEMCRPVVGNDELTRKYPEIAGFSLFNTGVLAANYKTYCRLYDLYNDYWPAFSPLFDSYVKQQWLLSYIIQKHFEPVDLPYSIHCNAYSPPLVREADTKRWCFVGESASIGFKFCIGPDVVVLNHHIRHESQLEIKALKKTIRWLVKVVVLLAAVCVFLIIRSMSSV